MADKNTRPSQAVQRDDEDGGCGNFVGGIIMVISML